MGLSKKVLLLVRFWPHVKDGALSQSCG